MTTPDQAQPMRLLAKASAVLDLLAEAGELTPAEVPERLGEPCSSVYRLLSSMGRLKLVEPAGVAARGASASACSGSAPPSSPASTSARAPCP